MLFYQVLINKFLNKFTFDTLLNQNEPFVIQVPLYFQIWVFFDKGKTLVTNIALLLELIGQYALLFSPPLSIAERTYLWPLAHFLTYLKFQFSFNDINRVLIIIDKIWK